MTILALLILPLAGAKPRGDKCIPRVRPESNQIATGQGQNNFPLRNGSQGGAVKRSL